MDEADPDLLKAVVEVLSKNRKKNGLTFIT